MPSFAAAARRNFAEVAAGGDPKNFSSATLIHAAIGDATRRNYAGTQARYAVFCRARGIEPLPVNSSVVVEWLADEAKSGKAARTLGTYRSAISTMHEESVFRLLPNPASDPHITRLLKGYARINAATEDAARARRPVTLEITPTLLTEFAPFFTLGRGPEDVMMWAAVCLGTFAGLRIGELVGTRAHPERRLTVGRLVFYRSGPGKRVVEVPSQDPLGELPSYFTLDLGITKADASGVRGMRTVSAPLAVAAMWKWVHVQAATRTGRGPRALFFHRYELSLQRLVSWLQDCFDAMGQGRPHITGKTFRRGLASELEASGVPRAAAAEYVGWAGPSMLGVYSSSASKEVRAIAIGRSLGRPALHSV